MSTQELQERLAAIQQNIADVRDKRAEALKTPGRYTGAVVKQADANLALLKEKEREVLSQLSRNGSTIDRDGHIGRGWEHVAHRLDLPGGVNRVVVPAVDLLPDRMAAVDVTPSSHLTQPAVRAPFAPLGQDRRFLFPSLVRQPLDNTELAVSEFRQTGSRTVTGSVERDPVATTTKAKLDLSIELATESARQFAVVIDDVPNKLFEVEPALMGFLNNELGYQVNLAVDAHALAQITAATPPSGSTGTGLIAQIRHAISAMRGQGANPTIVALNPTDAATLDLTTSSGSGEYVFAVRDTGSASPLWTLQVVEVMEDTPPILIDPYLLSVLYLGGATVLVDPYTGMEENTVRVRVEIEGLHHIRDAAGAYIIEA